MTTVLKQYSLRISLKGLTQRFQPVSTKRQDENVEAVHDQT
jgi:hypothetical protein